MDKARLAELLVQYQHHQEQLLAHLHSQGMVTDIVSKIPELYALAWESPRWEAWTVEALAARYRPSTPPPPGLELSSSTYDPNSPAKEPPMPPPSRAPDLSALSTDIVRIHSAWFMC